MSHLGHLALSEAESLQVREELAAHLEDSYLSLRAQGVSESEAVRLTCDQVSSWQELRREILAAKSEAFMQNRVSQLWIPGLVTLFGSAALLAAIRDSWACGPCVIHPGDPSSIVLYFPWLFSLPLFGALGAYLSLRARAKGLAVHCAGAFPALIMAAALLAVLLVALVLDRHGSLRIMTTAFAAAILNWFFLPGFFLLLGDLLLQSCNESAAPRRTNGCFRRFARPHAVKRQPRQNPAGADWLACLLRGLASRPGSWCAFLADSPFAFVIDPHVPLRIKGTAFAALMLNWVILPGIALCLGVALQSLRKIAKCTH